MTSNSSFEDSLALGVIGVVLAALVAAALWPSEPSRAKAAEERVESSITRVHLER